MSELPKLKDDEVIHSTTKKEIKRISLNLLMHQVFAFFNFERGYLHNILLLLKNPGKHIRAYLSIERNRLLNPFKFYFIGASLYAFVFLKIYTKNSTEIESNFEGDSEFKSIFIDYIQLWFLLVVFFIAYYSYLLFKRSSGYNWAENLVFNLYVMGVILFINSLLFPLELVLEKSFYKEVFVNVVSLIYFVYTYVSFFKTNYLKTITLSVASMILGGITLILSIILVGVVYGLMQSYVS